MKYFVYISDTKIGMFFSHLPRKFLASLSGELKASLGVVSSSLKQSDEPESKNSRLSADLSFLEGERSIGGIDDPKEYFRGRLQMLWGPYEQIHREAHPPLVYFGAETSLTSPP